MTKSERQEWLREVSALMVFEEKKHMDSLNRDLAQIMNSVDKKGGK